ncbi:MAG: glycoside hydrolase family 3 N-terminal domain-containing protein [Anaerolineales bacterium]
MKAQRVVAWLMLAMVLFSLLPAEPAGAQQTDPAMEAARFLLTQMTPEERVGQLFLVTFVGASVDEESQIYDLITRHHVGGVVLLASHDNFLPAPDTVTGTYHLITALQAAEWQSSQGAYVDPLTREYVESQYVPLFIGIAQTGDSYPDNQILSGLTPLPSQMAIGATWQSDLAEQVGQVAGRELSAIGFNLFFGPSLDVLTSPESPGGSGIGVSTFGGDPYWVSEMGRAYIGGLHQGSNGRILVVATHFPGRGSADRPAGDEPATVRKSLEQLKQIELAPFFAVTGGATSDQTMADGLLVSHIRYQGFQGNIRSTTRPVSLDQSALDQILALPEFADWRSRGGLLVSDDLGSRTIRAFYDPGGTSFSGRLVARDAFLAGNDLIYLGDIVSSDAEDNYTTVIRILDFFARKYQEDPAFAARVDEAVLRILAAKYRLYGSFRFPLVIPRESGLEAIGNSDEVTLTVARQAATLISPSPIDLDVSLASPPLVQDRILFLTDSRLQAQCSTCPAVPVLAPDALLGAVVRLYGPEAGGLVSPNRLTAHSFDELSLLLDGNGGGTLEGEVRSADWIVIGMLDAGPGSSNLTVLRRFLSERQDLLRNKQIIVFAFGAPYYLDATDISKLTAYYGIYSCSGPFVDVAARLLFQELAPAGALPVSVPGVGYDLFVATSPDPEQVIGLYLDLPSPSISEATPAFEPTPTPAFRIGDTITVHTGVIVDHNQNPVPDGTGVRFVLSASGESGLIQEVSALTVQGVARTTFRIDRAGLLEVRAVSEPARTSVVLQLNVSAEGLEVATIAPTSSSGAAVPTPASSENLPPLRPPLFADGRPGLAGWFLLIVILAGVGYLVFWMGGRFDSAVWGLRWALCAILGGTLAYLYLALDLPGGADLLMRGRGWALAGVVLLGAAAGGLGGWFWRRRVNAPEKQSD